MIAEPGSVFRLFFPKALEHTEESIDELLARLVAEGWTPLQVVVIPGRPHGSETRSDRDGAYRMSVFTPASQIGVFTVRHEVRG